MVSDKKSTLAFVDHSFHQTTKCTDFLKDILRDNFVVNEYWDEGWKNGPAVSASALNKEDYVFFFQVLPSLTELKRIKSKIVWAPMYDGISSDPLFWKNLSRLPIKILSFSQKISTYCQKFGLEELDLQYFKNPAEYQRNIPLQGKHLFFWYRGNISFEDLKKHLIADQIDTFTIISNPDPSYKPLIISEEDRVKFKITLLNKNFATNEPYLEIVSKSNIFISPRRKEGIGMSFLEALAMGMIVVANDDGTMNEYVQIGKNGYLFNLGDENKIDFQNYDLILKKSGQIAKAGKEKWLTQKNLINDYILADYRDREINEVVFWLDYFRLFVIKKLKRLKNKIIN